jgi:hypothetical protein
MKALLNNMPEETRAKLRGNLHKVAATMVKQRGTPLARDEITVKEAAYLIGRQMFLNRLEKQAMLNGIMCVRQLGG